MYSLIKLTTFNGSLSAFTQIKAAEKVGPIQDRLYVLFAELCSAATIQN